MIENIFATVLCLLLPIGLFVSVILGIHAGRRDFARIQRQMEAGVYKNWSKPPIATQVRFYAGLMLIALSVFVVLLAVLVMLKLSGLVLQIVIVVEITLGLIVISTGLLMYNKVLSGKG